MDYSEAIEVVYRRIGELINPQNAAKVLGFILLQNEGVYEMFRLANAPTHVLQTLVDEVEQKLCPSLKSSHSSFSDKGKKPLEFTPLVPFSYPSQNLQHFPSTSSNSSHNLHNQPHVYSLEEKFSSCNLNRPFHPSQETNTIPFLKPSSSCPNIPHELAKQVCDDFSRGYCRHGGECKLLHLRLMENGCIMILNPKTKDDTMTPDHALQRGTLKHLEMELVELLRCRRNIPVTISSIPILYYDKYAMPLQVEGYLLDDRNKENFICTMKELLAQMEKTICILNRPHGRPSIVLAEDLTNTTRSGHGMELQVYMTFIPQSTLTEQDAYSYFENFGPVHDVNIPHRVKRMFGFVTFVYPETTALVLSKTNPHYIRGSRVMVKPYRVQPLMLVDRP